MPADFLPWVIVIDPRADHGPGIGGFKRDSEVGMALCIRERGAPRTSCHLAKPRGDRGIATFTPGPSDSSHGYHS
nr:MULTISPECIES: DUF3141 domain-containing protein [Cupriavidus]